MSIKTTIHVYCPRCGGQQVKRHSGLIWYNHCNCIGVPGPPTPPRSYRPGDVIVVEALAGKARHSPGDAPDSP